MDKETFLALIEKIVNGTATEDELTLYNRYFNHFQEDEDALKKISWKKWLRAAAAVLIIMAGSWAWIKYKHPGKTELPPVASEKEGPPLPGRNQAILTLANGNKIVLDDTENGTVAQQGDTRISKLNDGQLAYDAANAAGSEAAMNELSTPYGGQYQLKLPDGSMVWLNAGSSLRYPAAFTGKERKVELTGEAYFEVTKDPKRQFKVKIKDMEVAVYGTSFNIMGYDDEGTVKTSLLNGSVKLRNKKDSVMLEPGQQSGVDINGEFKVEDHANMAQIIAWKNDLFDFDGADIQMIMRQLSRWYNIEVVYEGKIDQHFTGKIRRSTEISKVLQMLEMTEKVRFTINGRKITVSPVNKLTA